MAGVAGFEPAHAGIKIPWLTACRHPKKDIVDALIFTQLKIDSNRKFQNCILKWNEIVLRRNYELSEAGGK